MRNAQILRSSFMQPDAGYLYQPDRCAIYVRGHQSLIKSRESRPLGAVCLGLRVGRSSTTAPVLSLVTCFRSSPGAQHCRPEVVLCGPDTFSLYLRSYGAIAGDIYVLASFVTNANVDVSRVTATGCMSDGQILALLDNLRPWSYGGMVLDP